MIIPANNLPHRWEHNLSMRGWECVGIPVGGVDDGTRCPGCFLIVTARLVRKILGDEELPTLGWRVTLDMIAEQHPL